ncbi:MAG: UDP-galactopyranose mutase [Chthoniobacter sp.]
MTSRADQFLIVGAGFSGAVMARELVERLETARVLVIERKGHIAGNCHTERDAATGVMVHRYGPHIFNTNNEAVWSYVTRFSVFRPFVNRVKAVTPRGIFSLPINLLTINQFFGKAFNPTEARAFVATLGEATVDEPRNFEEQALRMMGRDLYENFFLGYSLKQWGCHPRELPASILKRLPIRFNYDDNYYDKKHQGIPEHGYTEIVRAILDHPRIEVRLETEFREVDRRPYNHVFYTGPLDAYFDYQYGRLGYRTVTFERIDADGDYQGNAVINYTAPEVPWTRIHEHKHFAPWEKLEKTVAFREFSQETGSGDDPYYPKRLEADKRLLSKYRDLAATEKGVTFLGRLATYRYMDMEMVIGEALDYAAQWLASPDLHARWPVFPNEES